AAAGDAGMRITLSAILSASCSNLSPGWLTVIFAWTAEVARSPAGAKKLLWPDRAIKGCRAACATATEGVVDDLSALVFISSSAKFEPVQNLHSTHRRRSIHGNFINPTPQGSRSNRTS